MNLKELNYVFWAKLIAIATLIIIFLTRTELWGIIAQAITPVIYAFVIAYILDYMVRFLVKRFKFKRGLAILVTFIFTLSLVTLVGALIVPRIIDAVAALVKLIAHFDFDYTSLFNQNFDNIYLNEIQQSIISVVTPMVQRLTNATGDFVLILVNKVSAITSGLISFVVALIISIYMLGEKHDLMARLKRVIFAYFNDKQSNWILNTFFKAHMIFKDFVVGKLIDSFIIGIIAFIALTIFKFPFAILIAVIIAVTNMIPYFGPFLGAVPAAIITFIAMPEKPIMVVWMLLIILIIQQLDGWIIGPIILGDSVGVSAFWIILAVTIGGATFGVIGMFLGVPFMVLFKTLIEEDIQKRLYNKGYDGLEEKNIKKRKPKPTQESK